MQRYGKNAEKRTGEEENAVRKKLKTLLTFGTKCGIIYNDVEWQFEKCPEISVLV